MSATKEELMEIFGRAPGSTPEEAPVQMERGAAAPDQADLMAAFGRGTSPEAQAAPSEIDVELMTRSRRGQQIGMQRDIARRTTGEEFADKAGIFTKGVLKGAADLAELPGQIVGGAIDEAGQHLGILEPGEYPVQGALDSIIRFDESVEQLGENIQPLTPGEFGIQQFGENIGASTLIGAGLAARGRALQPLVTPTTAQTMSASIAANPAKFAAAETAVATGGGIGASVMAAGGTTPEEMQERAVLGNVVGSLGTALTPATIKAAKSTAMKMPLVGWLSRKAGDQYDKMAPVVSSVWNRDEWSKLSWKDKLKVDNWKNMINLDNIEKHTKSDVLNHLDSLVPVDLRPKVEERLKAVRALQELDPEFNPPVGAIIGTPKARAFQQIVDMADPNFAQVNHEKTLEAMQRIRAKMGKNPEFAYKDQLQELFESVAMDTQDKLDDMDTAVTAEARQLFEELFTEAGDPTKLGEASRANLENMQTVYKKMRDNLYEQVKPPKNVKFKIDGLNSFLDEIKPETLSEKAPEFLRTGFAKFLKETQVDEKTGAVTFETLDSLSKRVTNEISDLRATNPNSTHLRTLSALKGRVEDIIDKGVDSLPEGYDGLKRARNEARRFVREEFAPRFRQGVINDLQRINDDGTYSIADDTVMSQFWQKGDKTSGAQGFKALFDDVANQPDGVFDMDDVRNLSMEAEQARRNLEKYALHTLETELKFNQNATKNPEAIVNAWKKQYRGALQEFPEIARKFETMDDVFNTVASNRQDFINQRDALNSTLIHRYLKTDPDTVVDTFMRSKPEAKRILDTIDSVYSATPEKADQIRKAIQDSAINRILRKATDPKTGDVKYSQVSRMLHDSEETLNVLLGNDTHKMLRDFNRGLAIIEDRPGIAATAQPNKLKELLDDAGVSPASILSRYYSASLGKVGPLYLGTDAATRFITKKAETHFKQLYRELMYDPKSLEDLETLLKESIVETAARPKAPKAMYRPYQSLFSSLGIKSTSDWYDKQELEGERAEEPFGQTMDEATQGVEEAVTTTPAPVDADDATRGELGVIENEDGSTSTEISITENIPELGGWVNIPTLVKGQVNVDELTSNPDSLTPEQTDIAVNRAIERVNAGATLPTYSSLEEAVQAAQGRSNLKGEDAEFFEETAPAMAEPQAQAEDPRQTINTVIGAARGLKGFQEEQRQLAQEEVTDIIQLDPSTFAGGQF